MPRRNIPSLDGLRAVSISMVVVYHLAGNGLAGPLGNLGVRVFFVISGYLITRLLLEEQERRGSISIRRFYKRRALRIFPPFYVYLCFVGVVWTMGLIQLNKHDLIEAGLYAINYFPGKDNSLYVRHIWSLAVEEQFYLLWPCLLRFGGQRRAFSIATGFLLISPIIRLVYWFFAPGLHDVMDRRFETVADALASGCVLAGFQSWLSRNSSYNRFLQSKVFLLVPAIPYLTYVVLGNHAKLFYGLGITIANLSIALCIDRWVRFPGSAGGSFLNTRLLRWIGVISYSIYLWQQPFLDPAGTALYNRFPLNIGLAILFALGSFFLVERPIQRARSRPVRAPALAAAD